MTALALSFVQSGHFFQYSIKKKKSINCVCYKHKLSLFLIDFSIKKKLKEKKYYFFFKKIILNDKYAENIYN